MALTPTDIIIFGGHGDLALRKIIPALYYRHKEGQLPRGGRIIGVGRTAFTRKSYIAELQKACKAHVGGDFRKTVWESFARRLDYVALDAAAFETYAPLKALLHTKPAKGRMVYLATPAGVYGDICRNLSKSRLITPATRIVLEKPLGQNLASFEAIDANVRQYFDEKQIYRIDHYLGKETVQNLMILRFANPLFARVWEGDAIDHVQITVSESLGIGTRTEFYDSFGALRDMVQNHLLQLLCLVAMEPPNQLSPHEVRREKLKVLEALRPITGEGVRLHTVRGQYGNGKIGSKKAASYVEEVGHKSDTETFVALRAFVDNWRWSGIPFYLRTGKRLAERYSEIVIQFKPVPHLLFPDQSKGLEGNQLIIRLQPDEHVKLRMLTKIPGPGGYRLKPVELNLSLSDVHEERSPDAYERLLMDVIRGNPTLFMQSDEVREAWRWTDGIINGWKHARMKSARYTAGSQGPKAAADLLTADGRQWHETISE
ncbi:MAG: zwf [Rickettsiales bacterium]|jgi:glucose-6-phosphate 1-dehydrogenase|nr:zwf [Rickettsiales bacterium]